jgi:predicted N-acetyltransferase YhbS
VYSDPRPCTPEELPAVVRLANRVFTPNGLVDMGTAFPLLFCRENAEHLRVIDREGEIIALVGICIREALLLGTPLRVASIGAVCTDSACRAQGLASRLMADARAHAVASGADLMLISGGRGLYHRLGYVTVGRFCRYQVSSREASDAVEVAEYRPEDLAEVRTLHAGEPIRFRRSLDDWERLLEAGMLICEHATLWVVRCAGRPVAYMAVQQPRRQKDGRPGRANAEEYAGDRWAIAEAAPAVAQRMGADGLELFGPSGDLVLATHATARRWSVERRSFPGTVGILRPRELLAELGPWIAERLRQRDVARLRVHPTETETRFEVDGENYVLETPGQLAALLFGGDTEEARSIPPLAGKAGALLEALFPMPLLAYGYNFV